MDWKDLAGKLIQLGAPAAGTLLGGPIGGTIGGIVGNVIAGALGVEATPEAVNAAIDANPAAATAALTAADQKIVAQYGYLTELAKAQAEAAIKSTEAVNTTIQTEAKTSGQWWGYWRNIMAYELAAECPGYFALFVYCVAVDPAAAAALLNLSGLVMMYMGARFGVLGVHVWTGSNERQTAMTGTPQPGIGARIVKAIKG